MKYSFLYIACLSMLASSCSEMGSNGQRGAIILGDSATIVTETDSQYLKDDVLDIGSPAGATEAKEDKLPEEAPKAAAPAADTITTNTRQGSLEKGFTINFGDIQVVLGGMEAREIKKQDPRKQDGVAYMLTSPGLTKAKVYVYGAKEVSVRQRYQSQLMLKSSLGMVDLRSLGLYTSDWTAVSTSGNGTKRSFNLNSLDRPDFLQVTNAKLTNATDRELRKRKTNRRSIQAWLKDVKKIRRPGDNPSDVVLDNVQWQISGKDGKGNSFQKTIRLDI